MSSSSAVRVYPYHTPPEIDPRVGSPALTPAVEAIAAGRAWHWRRARPQERPGYDPGPPPTIPDDAYYALDLPWTPTADEATALDAAFAAWVPTGIDVEALRLRRLAEIARETKRRILAATFSHAGQTFSLTLEDRVNIGYMAQFAAALPYPLTIYNADDTDTIALADVAAVQAFAGSALGAVLALVGGGQAVKDAVLAAQTAAEIEAACANYLAGG